MKFIIIFFTLMLSSLFCISSLGESSAQVTWNTFRQTDNLFSIQIPSNWNVSEMRDSEALAPFDYMFVYKGQQNSFAWIELLISEPLFTSPRAALESYISQYQGSNNFKQLLPIECNTHGYDNSTACFLLSSQQLEGELKRNVLNMVSITSDGIQTDFVFITSSNIFGQLLPVGEYMIKSLEINSTQISQTLSDHAAKDIQVTIPPIPSSNTTTSSTQNQLENKPIQISNTTWTSQQLTFGAETNSFVSTMPQGFGMYDKKNSNIFAPGEDILLYIEPTGYSFGTIKDNKNGTLYTVKFSADFAISDILGNILTFQNGIPVSQIISHHQNKEIFIPFTITQTSPFPPGNYVITYTIHDKNSGASFDIKKEIVISESQSA